MSTWTSRPRLGLCAVLCGLLLVGTLSACGKKGSPGPPPGEESRYTYPETYPDPASVIESGRAKQEREQREPAAAGGISTFPTPSRSRTTYGSGAAQ